MAGTVGARTVGRESELERIAADLAEAGSGRGGALLLAGEPGIGKTRLALEATGLARRRGFSVAWGRCPEAGAAPALWPWVQVVRELVALEGAAGVRARLGAAAADPLALADAGDLLTVGDRRSAELVASQRFRLFEGVIRLVGGGGRPVLVVLEDLHRGDELSIELLRSVIAEAGRLPLLVLATYRDADLREGGALAAALAEVAPLPWCADVLLGPLRPDDAALLVASVAAVPEDAVANLVRRGGGNPFFLQQLARMPSGSGSAVPTSVRELIRDRVGGLSADCRELLQALAVAGRAGDLAMVAGIVGLPLDAARTVLAPAAAQGLLVTEPGERTARFPHALLQEVLYAELEPHRRAVLHERFAAALAPMVAADAGLHAALADHALRAARGGRPVDSVAPLRGAARAAAGRLAFAEAARLLTDALAECGNRLPERTAVLLELGEAEVHAGRPAVARGHFERAAELAARLGDPPALARAALGVGSCAVTVGHVDWELVGLLRGAARELGADEGRLRARLLARLAVELYWHAAGTEARAASAEALAAADGLPGDPGTLAEALWARLFTLRGPDRLDQRLAIGRRLVDVAVRERLDDVEARGRVWLLPELLRAGELEVYRAGVERLARLGELSGQPLHRWYAELFAAQRATLAGAVDEATTRSDAAAELAARLGAEAGAVYHLAQQVAIRRDVGGLEALVEPLAAIANRFPTLVTLRMLLAVVRVELGRPVEAAADLAPLAADGFASVPPDSLWTATLCYGVEVAAALGHAATAATAARLLEPYRGTCAVQGLPVAWGAVDRAVGIGRVAGGDPAGGVSALEHALALHERWGFVPAGIRTRLDLASALPVGDEAGRRLAEHALAQAAARGLHRLADRAAVLLAAPRRLHGPGGTLSPREMEVLGLVADGASNSRIAAVLVLSVNTVERHVRNVYVKLGVANRAEAAAVAARHATRSSTGSP